MKPNETELDNLTKSYFTNTVEKLIEYMGLKYLVVTRGGDGVSYFTVDGKENHYSVYDPNITPVDITGAGDTFTAVLGLAYATGYGIEDCIQLANFASGVSIKYIGTHAPTIEEFKDFKL
jgi:sugar/nucleoside kinase (ribokinase family)